MKLRNRLSRTSALLLSAVLASTAAACTSSAGDKPQAIAVTPTQAGYTALPSHASSPLPLTQNGYLQLTGDYDKDDRQVGMEFRLSDVYPYQPGLVFGATKLDDCKATGGKGRQPIDPTRDAVMAYSIAVINLSTENGPHKVSIGWRFSRDTQAGLDMTRLLITHKTGDKQTCAQETDSLADNSFSASWDKQSVYKLGDKPQEITGFIVLQDFYATNQLDTVFASLDSLRLGPAINDVTLNDEVLLFSGDQMGVQPLEAGNYPRLIHGMPVTTNADRTKAIKPGGQPTAQPQPTAQAS